MKREEIMLEQTPLTDLSHMFISEPSSQCEVELCMDISCYPLTLAELTFQSQVLVR